jgi:ASC-1-like (ASCH) protein
MNIVSINVNEPYKTFILEGKKTVEGRLNKGKFSDAKIGDVLQIDPEGQQFKIIGKNIYLSFKEMIEMEGIENVIPGKENINDAVDVYYNFYTKEQEKEFGVVAIKIDRITK